MKTTIGLLVLMILIGHTFASRTEAQSLQKQELASETLTKFRARPDLAFNFEYFVYLTKGKDGQ